MGLLSALLLLVAADGMLLNARIDRLALTMTTGATGQTWVIVGSDSRAAIPAGAAQSQFGSTDEVTGARADIVLIVHREANGRTSTFSLPRDLLVHDRAGRLNRLALAFQVSPQSLVDSLCATLNVPTDHFVVVDFAVFTSVVDALGGIIVNLPTPVRDPISGLDLTTAGPQRLTGHQALALVRSRHTERFAAGRWVAVADAATQRTSWGAVLFATIQHAAAQSSSLLLRQRLAWIASGSIQTDQHTSVADLATLAYAGGPVIDVPARAVPGGLPMTASSQTYATLSAGGFSSPCR